MQAKKDKLKKDKDAATPELDLKQISPGKLRQSIESIDMSPTKTDDLLQKKNDAKLTKMKEVLNIRSFNHNNGKKNGGPSLTSPLLFHNSHVRASQKFK